jgi:group II intron reverse transcriptase/maturase
MQKAEAILNVIQDRGRRGLKLERIYRQLFNSELYLQAYANLYSNKGATTPGITEETIDGMSLNKIYRLIDDVKHERLRWTPVRRTYIPKKNGSTRPLGIPTWRDKLLQEVIRLLLDAYFEPQFSDHSHGFRPKRGCHTALEEIKYTCRGTKWFIEGDISKCFDSFDHGVMVKILREYIEDERFIRLTENLLTAGYMENWRWNATLSGTPQGSGLSPLMSNLYLNEFDKFVEQKLIPQFHQGEKRRRNAEYRHYEYKKGLAKARNDRKSYKAYDKKLRSVPALDPYDPDYRRLRYIRYADDFLLAFVGTRTEAEEIKQQITDFMSNELKLQLSETKTLITHASTESARFLGYEISVGRNDSWRDRQDRRNLNGEILLRLPKDALQKFCARYERNEKPIQRGELMLDSDFDIIARYQSEYRGYVQYYTLTQNLYQMNKLKWIMETSMLKTLANKYRSTVNTMVKKYQATFETPYGQMKGFRVIVERAGKKPLIAKFGGIPLRTQAKVSKITDGVVRLGSNRSQLIERLLADQCELCGSEEKVEVHHVRKLADLNKPGRKEKPLWVRRMAAIHRKTLVVCFKCHTAIHKGETRAVWNDKLESRVR